LIKHSQYARLDMPSSGLITEIDSGDYGDGTILADLNIQHVSGRNVMASIALRPEDARTLALAILKGIPAVTLALAESGLCLDLTASPPDDGPPLVDLHFQPAGAEPGVSTNIGLRPCDAEALAVALLEMFPATT
jgi:hypothetical protein